MTGGEHDLISWDPRGTSRTFLRFSCHKTAMDRVLAMSPDPLVISLDESDRATERLFAQAKVLADICAENLKEVGSYIGTAFTARDAMSIVDALDQGPLINYYGEGERFSEQHWRLLRLVLIILFTQECLTALHWGLP